MRAPLFVSACLLVSCACVAHQPAIDQDQALVTLLAEDTVEVPMDLSMHHVAVEVTVGEGSPVYFNLDTYAVTTLCVDEAYAEDMGFPVVGSVMNGDGSGQVFPRDLVLVPQLRVGGATFENVTALVDDYSWVTAPDGNPVKGLLGYHLFRDLLLELDYPAKTLRLSRGDLPLDGDHVVSHEVIKHQPDVPVTLCGKPVMLLVDSGAQSGLSLPGKWLNELDLQAPATIIGQAQTVYAEEEVHGGTLVGSLKLAGHVLPSEPATFSKIFGGPLLGQGILQRYRVTFDQANGRVQFLLPSEHSDAASTRDST